MVHSYSLLAGVFAAFASLVELIQRYSVGTKISFFFKNYIVWLYLLLNAVAGIVSYFILSGSDVSIIKASFGTVGKSEISMAVIAGLGSMAIMRSAFINLKLGETKYSVGPGVLLDILLILLDKKIDQNRAMCSAIDVNNVMEDIDYSKANISLPTVCLHMLEQVSRDDQEEVKKEIEKINTTNGLTQKARSLCLGISIKKIAGIDVLNTAVKILGDEILFKNVPRVENASEEKSGSPMTPAISVDKLQKLEDAFNFLNRM